jgi:hypothetical protein
MGEPMKRLWHAIALCASLLVPASAQVPANQGVTTVPGIPDHRVVRQRRSRDGDRDACGRGAKRFTYFCGFAATSGGATAAAVVNLTITNLVTGTATYIYGAVAAPAFRARRLSCFLILVCRLTPRTPRS